MKSFRIRAISLLVSVSFIFTGLTPSYGLAPGAVSGDLRPNGGADAVKGVVRASEGILHVIKESGYDIGDIAGQTEPPIGENSGVAERRVYSRDEVMADLKALRDQNQIRYLAYDLNNVLGRCLDKAQLPVESGKSRVEIKDFPMGEGELALMRMAKYGVGSGRGEELVLEVSTEFVVNYSKIAANDILFKIADGRFVSVAQGLAYRLGRHEAAWAGKKGGHYAGNGMELVRPEGADAYSIDGRYSVYNDAIMMWYVFSYCQDAAVWFNNENFGKLLNGAYYGGSGNGRTRAFKSYFPDLYKEDGTRNEERFGAAASLAKWINYNYFIKPVKDGSGPSSGKDVYQAVLDVVGSRAQRLL